MPEGGKMMLCWSPDIAANSDGDAMAQMRLEDVSAALEVSQRTYCKQCTLKCSKTTLCRFSTAVTGRHKENNVHTIRVSRLCKELAAG